MLRHVLLSSTVVRGQVVWYVCSTETYAVKYSSMWASSVVCVQYRDLRCQVL